MAYQVATGHDNEAGFVSISWPLHSTGPQFPRHNAVLSTLVYPDGTRGSVWTFQNMLVADYITFLGYLGLPEDGTVVSALVTISDIDHDRSAFSNWNATVIHIPRDDVSWPGHHDSYIALARFAFIKLRAT